MESPIGVVGLGLMGAALCKRLMAAGAEVVGYDLSPTALADAAAAGVKTRDSAAAVAGEAAVVLVCVSTPAAVSTAIAGADGVVAASPPAAAGRQVVVDLSTTDIQTTHAVGAALEQAGKGFVDAPVSGGVAAVEAGTLAIMAGGGDKDVERVRPLLERCGQVTHMGAVGAGQATKLVNQTLVLTNFCVIAEALRLAQAHGVDASKIPQALAPGYAGSKLLDDLMPRMASEDFAPRGYARQILKDLEMLHSATKDLPISMPMTAQATTLFRLLVASGSSELDGAAVVTLYPKADVARQ